MSFQALLTTYREKTTPVVNLCFATAAGAAAMAVVASLVNWFITPWTIAPGMLCVSGFYLLLGGGYLIQHLRTPAIPEPQMLNPPAPYGMKLDVASADHARSAGREMAQV
jgi:hypothetical protein